MNNVSYLSYISTPLGLEIVCQVDRHSRRLRGTNQVSDGVFWFESVAEFVYDNFAYKHGYSDSI